MKSHLWGAVKTALDVGVHGAVLKAGRAKIDDFDIPRLHALEQHVFRLEVAVDDVGLTQDSQRVQDLHINICVVK